MIETIWRKDFQNSVEKTSRAKENYQDMKTAKNVQRSRSLFRRFKEEGKGYIYVICRLGGPYSEKL